MENAYVKCLKKKDGYYEEYKVVILYMGMKRKKK